MDSAPKQQIVERIKQANNILVTVSNDPSVDQLASCIGLTLMLNTMGKHATAVFSGKIPSTLEFLQPEKTLESNTDSLRDFIISLDKSKADKLRYKVEDQVVRIFITPYRTKISDTDLIFSQGDFNVEVVVALGVKEREHIDNAISAHGRILHDATVVSLNSGEPGENNDVGSINWQEPSASSLCEMVVSISEAFGSGLIDSQMATAYLTGIVAETERFSNLKTTPKVMTMSAQLMAAGANQQLIASKLAEEVIAPVMAIATSGEEVQPNEGDDVIKIDHGDDEINIDEHGNFESVQQPEPDVYNPAEHANQNNNNEYQPVEEPKNEPTPEQNQGPELILPDPNYKPGPEIIKRHSSEELPDRLPVGDHQNPARDDNSYNIDSAHKVIEPLDHSDEQADEPESRMSTHRTILNADDDPAINNPFTSNAQSPHEGSPQNQIHDPGMLQHSKPSANVSRTKPEPPVEDARLGDIEKELHQLGVQPQSAPVSADSARQQVDKVLEATPYDENHPQPVQALNANPVEFDQIHNPTKFNPGSPTAKDPVPEPFKMPELAIKPITDLPGSLGDSAAEAAKKDSGPISIPAISVSPDGTLRVASQEHPVTPPINDAMAPPAPPPVPPPITPPPTQ